MVNRRQFIIMNQPYEAIDFNYLRLSCGLVLSYHKDLKVTESGEYTLIGHAFSCTKDDVEINEKFMETWAGRWVLITHNAIFTDACGTLGLFYVDSKTTIISSSLNLIKQVFPTHWTANYEIRYNDGLPYMDYYPIPSTPYYGIKKLLPTQYYSLSKGVLDYHEEWYKKYSDLNIETLYQNFKDKLINVFVNIKKEYDGNIWIPLTAGVDSRTNIAIAKKTGMIFGAYTAQRNNVDAWDFKAPAKICKKLSIPHFYMDDRFSDNLKRKSDYEEHCGGIVTVGTDKDQYIKGNDVPNAEKAIILWGTAWEVYGRNFWGTFELGDSPDSRFEAWNQYSHGAITKSNVHEESLRYWFNYIDKHPMTYMDWRQRMYYEQRIGSWLSGAYQAIDLFDSVRISPVNCYDIFGILMNLVDKTFAKDSRSTKCYQERLIDEFVPELRFIPYEKQPSIVKRIYKKIKKKI